jgi:membrane-bound serine protease (ClpP class)
MKLIRITLLTLAAALAFSSLARAQSNEPLAIIMTADGAIMPAMLEYFKRGIETAEQRNAEVLIIQLNTPGGSITVMSDIVEAIGKSRCPW